MNDARLFARGGWRAHKEERFEEATAAFARAVELEPSTRAYWNGYAVSLASLFRLAEACEALQRSLKLDPSAIDIWCIYGELSYERGDLRNAATAFARCVALDPTAEDPAGRRARGLIKRVHKSLKK